MRTNLAERLGYEPEESTEERQARLREAYQTRKAMRRLARLGCCWLSGVSFALCEVFGVAGLGRSVLIVETAMPVVTQTVVAAAEYGADEEFAAQGAALSTIACFVVIPVLMLIL